MAGLLRKHNEKLAAMYTTTYKEPSADDHKVGCREHKSFHLDQWPHNTKGDQQSRHEKAGEQENEHGSHDRCLLAFDEYGEKDGDAHGRE